MPRSLYKHDWAALKSEWLLGTENLTAFRIRKKIGHGAFWRQIEGWQEERAEMQRKGLERIKSKAVTAEVKKWERQLRLTDALQAHISKLLRKGVSSDGDIVMPLEPHELAALSMALERTTKTQRLLVGESTENNATNHYHDTMVDMIEKLENGSMGIIEGEVVEGNDAPIP